MLFNSFYFLLFFPIVILLYYSISPKYRWALLLVASYYFYASWRLEYLTLIIISTLVDYFAGIQISKAETKRSKKLLLSLSLIVNLGLLGVFKYYYFATDSIVQLANYFNIFVALPDLKVLLPVGISFYTFQTLSYTIDVYRGKTKPERHLGIFAVYVAFFPQLVAGPIERPSNLIPQLKQVDRFNLENVKAGLQLMLWGFVKKVVIADRLAIYVDQVYAAPSDEPAIRLLTASYFFTFQLYCDFSGYSDIAIGAAKIMNKNLMINFRQPFFSASVREFWQRWHISLSSWFRDYVYFALGGNRRSKLIKYRNLIITFVLSGLWHGANWTFVIWGFLHGLVISIELFIEPVRRKIKAFLLVDKIPQVHYWIEATITYHLLMISVVFFRADNMSDVLLIESKIFSALASGELFSSLNLLALPTVPASDVWFMVLMILGLQTYDYMRMKGYKFLEFRPVRLVDLSFQFWAFLVFGAFNNQQFVYFQF